MKNKKAGDRAKFKVFLKFPGLPAYGKRAVKLADGTTYTLFINILTQIDPAHLEELRRIEPNIKKAEE